MLDVIRVNWSKQLIELRRYLPNTISLIITFYAIFLLLFLGIRAVGDPNSADSNIQYVIVSNAFWMLLMMSFLSMAQEITDEAIRGTLEQLYMSPVPAWRIVLARAVSSVVIYLFLVALVVVLAMLTSGQWLSLSLPAALLLGVPTVAAVLGLGFIGAGMALLFKQVGSILQVGQFVLMAMAFAPGSLVPGLAFIPAMKGIDLVRRIATGELSLTQVGAADITVVFVNGAVWLGLGLLAFRMFERRALRTGVLGKY